MVRSSHRPSFLGLSTQPARAALIDRVDPRTRIVTALAFSVVIAVARHLETVGIALLLAAAATILTSLPVRVILKRLAPINVFALLLVVFLPWTTRSAPVVPHSAIQFGSEGFHLAVTIAVKANAMVLWIVVLLGTMNFITLGHALSHLGVPDKLTHLLLFTVRYIDVLHGEYLRLRTAMKTRGFRLRNSSHTYRCFGYLVGMLLVRSLDRSERVLAAMKCRGFRGRFYLLDHFAFSRRDVWFLLAASAILVLLAFGEYS